MTVKTSMLQAISVHIPSGSDGQFRCYKVVSKKDEVLAHIAILAYMSGETQHHVVAIKYDKVAVYADERALPFVKDSLLAFRREVADLLDYAQTCLGDLDLSRILHLEGSLKSARLVEEE